MHRMPFIPWVAAAAFAALVATPAGAQTAESGVEENVVVNADRLQLNQADRTALFQGNVVAQQGSLLTLKANEMEVHYGDGASSQPDTPNIEKIFASGDVHITLQGDTVQGEEAVYDLESGLFEATGGVLLIQGGNEVRGQKFTANLLTGWSEVTGGVRVELTPVSGESSGANQ